MEVDDEDDFYSPEPSSAKDNAETKTEPTDDGDVVPKQEDKTELEEGEEEDEGGAMDEDDDDSVGRRSKMRSRRFMSCSGTMNNG